MKKSPWTTEEQDLIDTICAVLEERLELAEEVGDPEDVKEMEDCLDLMERVFW